LTCLALCTGQNEVFSCGCADKVCNEPQIVCKRCTDKCLCKPGFVRHPRTKKCILEKQCPLPLNILTQNWFVVKLNMNFFKNENGE